MCIAGILLLLLRIFIIFGEFGYVLIVEGIVFFLFLPSNGFVFQSNGDCLLFLTWLAMWRR